MIVLVSFATLYPSPQYVPINHVWFCFSYFFHLIWGIPCIPIFIWFNKSISCLYKKVTSVSKRGGSKEGVYENGAAWCFKLLRMCCRLDGKETIRVVLNTALSRQMNTVVNRIRNELGAIFKMRVSQSFSLLLVYVAVQRAGGSILMCLQKKYTLVFSPSALCKKPVPAFMS